MGAALKLDCQRVNGTRGKENLPTADLTIDGDIESWPVKVIDIGHVGLGIETDLTLGVGDKVVVGLVFDDKVAALHGRIVNSHTRELTHRYGISLNGADSVKSLVRLRKMAEQSGASR